MIVRANDKALPAPTATPSTSALANSAPIVSDGTPITPLAMIVIKIYAFGGLAVVGFIILSAITYWIWIVVIKREFADSPPDLELHPERMREKEKARIKRLKKEKETKKARCQRQNEERFLIAPIRYNDPSPSLCNGSVGPSKPSLRKSSVSSVTSSNLSKGKRVSWASSTSTLNENGQLSEKPIQDASGWPADSVSNPLDTGYSRDSLGHILS